MIWQLFSRVPILRYDVANVAEVFRARTSRRVSWIRTNAQRSGQFKSPGRGGRGPPFGRQSFHGGQQGYPYPPGMERRMSSAGSEGDSFLQGPGEEGYDYQQLASDDSHDTQQSVGDFGQTQAGFHGAFGNGSGQPGLENRPEPQQGGDGGQGREGAHSPPDIKYEVTPMPFMKANDFELIEIDPDDEDDI